MRTTSNMNDYSNLKNDEKVKDYLMDKMITKNINYKIMYQRQKKVTAASSRTNLRNSIDWINSKKETIKQANSHVAEVYKEDGQILIREQDQGSFFLKSPNT